MKIIIGGAMGRMGREVTAAALNAGMEIVCGVDIMYSGQPMDIPMVTGFDLVEENADVLIDFSRADSLPEILALATSKGIASVLCTTGYTDVEVQRINEASQRIAILRSANMSLGVNLMEELVAIASRALADDFDVEIIEKHHRMKLDSPSGTALMFYDAVRGEKGKDTEPVYGRYGRTHKRTAREIGIHAVRGGTVTGEHEVGFYGNGEQIILTHRAENRALFAQGAIKAASFLSGKPAGLYSMRNVVKEILG